MEITNKMLRDQREFEVIFKDPKRARAAWSQNIVDRWARPALPPVPIYDKNNVPAPEYLIEKAVYEQLCEELRAEGLSRLPTEGEMMEGCQSYYARHNASSYIARRDSIGAKPIDETKQQIQVTNPLESLTDEELEVMQKALDGYHSAQALPDAPIPRMPDTKEDEVQYAPYKEDMQHSLNSAGLPLSCSYVGM